MAIDGDNSPQSNEKEADHDLLRQFLADRDVDCPQCGYNLRALVGNICPECGDRLTLQVGRVETRQAVFIAGLIGLSAGAGLNGLLIIYVLLRNYFFTRPFSAWSEFVAVNGCGLIAMTPCIIWWIRRWPWLRAQSITYQWRLVVICWALMMIDIIIFTWFIR